MPPSDIEPPFDCECDVRECHSPATRHYEHKALPITVHTCDEHALDEADDA
jgi:hypothetical protein